MYIPLWGVTLMSNCEVTLLRSGGSLVWALNVRLVFFVAVQKSLAWLSLFLALVFGVGAAAPALGFPLQLVPGFNELIYVMFLFPSPAVSVVGDLVDTPGCLPTLSGFCAVIHAGWTSVQGFSEEDLLRLRPKALSSYKVLLFKIITVLSNRASGPSCHSFAWIRLAYSHRGPSSSAAEGQWSHLRPQFELHPPCEW